MRKKTMTVLSVILVSYALITLVAVSPQFGNMIIFVAGILLGLDVLFYDRMNKKGKKIINTLMILSLVFSLSLTAVMVSAAHGHPALVENTDQTLIILGAKVNGNSPSLMLSRRLSAGLAYAEAHPQCQIIVTGGKGDNETMPEGIVMKQWLTHHGIQEKRILVEQQARNTGENLKYSSRIIEQNDLNPDIVIATDSFHQLRARILAQSSGLNKVQTVNADTPLLFKPMYFVREWFGLIKAVVFKK